MWAVPYSADVGSLGTKRGPFRVEIRVELKPGVLDAEAESIQKSLGLLGVRSVSRVTTARIYDLEFEGVNSAEASRLAHEAVDRLLANPVIHKVTVRPPTG
jgi:phosphoribosylformylglycinamidine synthase subunit PurS